MARRNEERTWRHWRRAAALAQAAAFLGLPFVKVGGESAFRFEIAEMKLHFFGTVLFIDEFSLLLPGVLFLLLLSVGVTAVFGRVWCGWMCGQTVLPLLAEWAAGLFPGTRRGTMTTILLLPVTALVSFSLLCFFVPPAEAARNLLHSPALLGFFLAQWAVLYGLLVFLGPRFCRTVCPYAMLQNVLFDRDTLTIAFDGGRSDDCFRCDLCMKVCPVGIDIKAGAQRECVACAECVDACAAMTSPRRVEPFIGYRGRILRGKTFLFAAVSAASLALILLLLHQRPGVTFSVQWEGKTAGAAVNRYRYAVRNAGDRPLALTLDVDGNVELIGGRAVSVPPRSRTTGRVMARAAGADRVTFVLAGDGFDLRSPAAFP